jgi:alanine racemase
MGAGLPASPLTAVVDLAALRTNLALVRRALAPDTEILACVKANAYGHGVVAAARALTGEGVRWLSLGSAAEALAIRRAGVASRLLLFPTVLPADPTLLLDAGVTIGIQSPAEAERLAGAGRPVSIFLKVDAGFGRVGVPLDDAVAVAARIHRELPALRLEGVFTHLPFSGVESVPWVQARLKEFGQMVVALRERVPGPLIVQALASTGIVRGLEAPETNAVSPGQLLFGVEASSAVPGVRPTSLGTRPVLTEVRTSLGAVRELPAGARFGAGGTRTAARPTRLGVLPIGYSNSLLVQKPGQTVRIGGQPVPVLSVSLEHAVVDVTDVPAAREGEPVILVARDSAVGPSLHEVARTQDRTPLEVLVSLTGRAAYDYTGA